MYLMITMISPTQEQDPISLDVSMVILSTSNFIYIYIILSWHADSCNSYVQFRKLGNSIIITRMSISIFLT